MKDNPFWQSFELLANSLSGSREESETTLDRLEAEIRQMPASKRGDLRHDLMLVVGQLARLATRINEMGGKSATAPRDLIEGMIPAAVDLSTLLPRR